MILWLNTNAHREVHLRCEAKVMDMSIVVIKMVLWLNTSAHRELHLRCEAKSLSFSVMLLICTLFFFDQIVGTSVSVKLHSFLSVIVNDLICLVPGTTSIVQASIMELTLALGHKVC